MVNDKESMKVGQYWFGNASAEASAIKEYIDFEGAEIANLLEVSEKISDELSHLLSDAINGMEAIGVGPTEAELPVYLARIINLTSDPAGILEQVAAGLGA